MHQYNWNAAQPAVPADRFAREIVRILVACATRLRQLNGKPLGRCLSYLIPIEDLNCGIPMRQNKFDALSSQTFCSEQLSMDQHLDARWRTRQSPFDGEIFYLDDLVPIGTLRTMLVSVVAVLQQHYQAHDLYTLADWHEHDGYLTPRHVTTWQALEQILANEQSLYDSRTGDTFVRQIYYPSDTTFLLRIYVLDEDEDTAYPGRWGDFDVSGARNVLDNVTSHLPETIQGLLRRKPADAYFDECYAG